MEARVFHEGMATAKPLKESFNKGLRRPTIIEQLTKILNDYSSDEQILKELIQNADDAGATDVKFILDHTNYRTEKLCDPELAKFQGPALYAFNSATFTPVDWNSLRMLGRSDKEGDPMKVGRFGLGFKSVFHITDFPGVLSGSALAFIDPHEKYFKCDGQKTSCMMWDLAEDDDRANVQEFSDQFEPLFCHSIFNNMSIDTIGQGNAFNGTLFRFPLRQAASANGNPWVECSVDKIRKYLFENLMKTADSLLLFLNHVENIEIYEKRTTDEEPELIFRDSLSETSRLIVRAKREAFREVIGSDYANVECFSIGITQTWYEHAACVRTCETDWAVSLYHAGIAERNDVDGVAKDLKVLPVCAVALPLLTKDSSEGFKLPNPSRQNGQVFCFMQLPLEESEPTGLCAHVHGYFAVEQNRRKIEWPAAGHEFVNPAHRWNAFIKTCMLPKAMAHLAEHVVLVICRDDITTNEDESNTEARYGSLCKQEKYEELLMSSLLPQPNAVKPQWKLVEEKFYREIAHKRVFPFPLTNSSTAHEWVSAYDARVVFGNAEWQTDVINLMRKVVYAAGKLLASATNESILAALERNEPNELKIARINCKLVSRCLKQNGVDELNNTDKFLLLHYLLEGLQTNESDELIGVSLLPLDDNTWIKFECSQSASHIAYLCETTAEMAEFRQLLPGLNEFFILSATPPDILQKFCLIASHGLLNMVMMRTEHVMPLLYKVDGLIAHTETTAVISNIRVDLITEQWMERIWRYLYQHHDGLDLNVAEQHRLHLIPQQECSSLVVLSKTTPIIVADDNADGEVIELCRGFGVTVINNVPTYVTRHPDITSYLSFFSAEGLLSVLRKIDLEHLIKTLRSPAVQDSQKVALRNFLADGIGRTQLMCEADRYLVVSIPIFQTLSNSGFQTEVVFVSLNEVTTGSNSWRVPLKTPMLILDLTDALSASLAGKVIDSLLVLSDVQVLTDMVLPSLKSFQTKYTLEIIAETMKLVCKHFRTELLHGELSEHIKSVNFIETRSNTLASASELYDDGDPLLADLFKDMDYFPCGEFATDEYRPVLKKLGLRQVGEIKSQDILFVAQYIDSTANDGLAELVEGARSAALMKVINIQNDISLLNELWELRWVCPVERPFDYPKMLNFVRETMKPCQVSSLNFAHLAGSARAMVDVCGISEVASTFGWNRMPPVTDVVQHLKNVINWYNNMTQQEKSECGVLCTVRRFSEDIYAYLEEAEPCDLSTLSNYGCIFIENYFMLPSRCAFSSSLGFQCLPFVAGLPASTKTEFGKFMRAVGINDQFAIDDLKSAFQELHERYGDTPVNDGVVNQVCALSRELYQRMNELGEPDINSENSGIWLPDSDKILRPSHQLCDNSTAPANVVDKFILKCCHSSISQTIAKRLGARSVDLQIFQSHLLGQPFGQKQRLTKRIRRILTGYPFGIEILKEFVQNADDAGATKLHFILDERYLPTVGVFGAEWRPLQGPALCVFNDKPFTQNDIEGIQQLGEGSKENDPTKIGKYGVGFSCIFHITDVPHFMTTVDSQKRICVFDPLCKHVPLANDGNPGRMFGDIRESYPDMFSGYLDDTYGLYNGTFFRFPLRQISSDLSEKVATVPLIRELFDTFRTCMHECLLFVSSLTEISLKRIDRDTGQVEEIYSVVSSKSESALRKHEKFLKATNVVAKDLQRKQINVDDINAQHICHRLTTTDACGVEKTWVVVRRLGYDGQLAALQPQLKEANDSNDSVFIPRADVAYLLRSSTDGTNTASLGPLGGEFSGQLFCFLPLPITHRLPVHINGHFALEYENRRNLMSVSCSQQTWNEHLMKFVIAEAYVQLLEELKEEVANDNIEVYRSAFPDVELCAGNYLLISMTKSVYSIIAERDLPLIPIYGRHVPLWLENLDWAGPTDKHAERSAHVDCFITHMSKNSTDADAQALCEIVVGSKMRLVVSCFSSLLDCFPQATVTVRKTSPENVLGFYSTVYKLPQTEVQLKDTPFRTVENLRLLLGYLKSVENVKAKLYGTPFLLSANEVLHTFGSTKSPLFVSIYENIVPHMAAQFIHRDVVSVLELDPQKDRSLCRSLSITDMVSALPKLLPPETFQGLDRNPPLAALGSALASFDFVGQSTPPSENAWLRTFWEFLASELHCALRNVSQENTHIERFLDNHVGEWCLLPVTSAETRLLLPIGKRKTVINVLSELRYRPTIPEKACLALQRLGIPQLDTRPFRLFHSIPFHTNSDSSWLLHKLFRTDKHNSVAIVNSLCSASYSWMDLQLSDVEALFGYLAQHVDKWNTIPGAVDGLRRLCAFSDIQGNVVRLSDYDVCNIMPCCKIPMIDSDIWSCASDRVAFIRCKQDSTNIFLKNLKCQQQTVVSLYAQYIFSSFSQLTDEGQFEHLMYVKDELLPLTMTSQHLHGPLPCKFGCDRCTLIAVLKTLAFMCPPGSSAKQPTSTFYDPQEAIFQVTSADSIIFPPEPYADASWLPFLRNCGLLTEPSQHVLLVTAKNLQTTYEGMLIDSASQSNVVEENAQLLSRAIIKEIQSGRCQPSDSFIREICTVAFIPLHRVSDSKTCLHAQHGLQDEKTFTLVAYMDSCNFSSQNLVWTCRNVLPSWVILNAQAAQHLGVVSKPPIHAVIENMKNLCKTLETDGLPTAREVKAELVRVMGDMYRHLNEAMKSVHSIRPLGDVPCIVIDNGRYLVKPQQVIKSAGHEIRPFIFQLPPKLHQFHQLFSHMGVAADPMPSHYAFVLSDIHRRTQEKLRPDDRVAIVKAVRGIFDKLRRCAGFDNISELYLPCTDEKLHRSVEIIVCDKRSYAERLSDDFGFCFLADLNSLDLDVSQREAVKLLSCLPEQTRPLFLSSAFVEKLNKTATVQHQMSVSNCLQMRLVDAVFQRGIFRLTRHALRAAESELEAVDEVGVKKALEGLNNLRFVECSEIATYLEFTGNLPQRTDESVQRRIRAAGERSCPFHVDEETVYVNTSATVCSDSRLPVDSVYCVLAELINKTLGNQLSTVLHHVVAILKSDIGVIERHLDDSGIAPCDVQTAPTKVRFVPLLSSRVDLTGPDFTLRHNETELHCGALAAFEVRRGEYIYVEIDRQHDEDVEDGEEMRYVVKTCHNPSSERVVHASSLYVFD